MTSNCVIVIEWGSKTPRMCYVKENHIVKSPRGSVRASIEGSIGDEVLEVSISLGSEA